MDLQQLTVGGLNFAYRWDGRPETDADAPVVMMAHAMGTSLRIWDLQVAALADRYRVLRYDWRGHGHSAAPPGPYSLAEFEADAVGVMDALGLPQVHWVGISTGGMIGQGLSINHAARIASLCLCNTTSQANQGYRDWVAERQAVVRVSGMVPVWEMTKRLWFTDPFVDSAGPDYQLIQDVFEATQVPGYLGGTSAVAELSYRDRLHQISCPTAIIAAGDDPVTPVDHSEAIRDRIPGARLDVVAGQRHFSNVEQPEIFNPLLRRHLDANLARLAV